MRSVLHALLKSCATAVAVAGLACCASTSGPPDSPARLAKASCMNLTGTSLAPPRSECLNAPGGRSYSNRDIDNTGVIDPAQALRMLDPAVSAGR